MDLSRRPAQLPGQGAWSSPWRCRPGVANPRAGAGAGAGPAEEPLFFIKRFLCVREMEHVSRHIFQCPKEPASPSQPFTSRLNI